MLAAFPSTNMTTLKQEHLLGGYTIRQTLYENLNQRCMLSHNLQSNDEIRNLFYVLHSQRIWQKARWMWRELNQNHTYSNQFLWHRCLLNESHQQFFDVPSGGGQAVRLDCRVACIMHGLPLFEDTYTVRGSYPAVARGGGGRQRGARDQNITWKYEGGDTRGRTATIPWTAESFFWRLEILGVSHTTLRSRRAGIAKCGQTSVIPPCKNPSNKSCLLSFFCAPILQWFAPLLTSGSVGKIHQNDLVPKALKKISDHFSSVVWIIFLGSQIGGPWLPQPSWRDVTGWFSGKKTSDWFWTRKWPPTPGKVGASDWNRFALEFFWGFKKGPKLHFSWFFSSNLTKTD